jgi:hypothetical protein
MFHNHITPWRICITPDKLCLNKLSPASTHASGIRLLSLQQGGFHFHMPYVPHGRTLSQKDGTLGVHQLACLNILKCYGLPEIPPTDWPIETSTCQHYHGIARIGFWPPIQPFSRRDINQVVGTDCSLCITGDIQHPHAMSLRFSAVWNLSKWTWRLTYMHWLHHLNAVFWKQNEWKLGKIV